MSEQDLANMTDQALNMLEAKGLDRIRELENDLQEVKKRIVAIRKIRCDRAEAK